MTRVTSATAPQPVIARYARRGSLAIIELAESSGLHLEGPNRITARHGSTAGTGRLVRHSIESGAREVVLAVGGSATTDGDVGIATELGVQFLDADDRQVDAGGAALASVRRIDSSAARSLLDDVNIAIATDVRNPLLGPEGAAAVFAPQKGASNADVQLLERGLRNLADVLRQASGVDVTTIPGARAAGGVGACVAAIFSAEITSGGEYLMRILEVDQRLQGADLVVTGEGSLDAQTLSGKAPVVVARAGSTAGAFVLGVAGRITISATEARHAGFSAVASISDIEPDRIIQIDSAGPLVRRVTAAAVRTAFPRQSAGSGQ